MKYGKLFILLAIAVLLGVSIFRGVKTEPNRIQQGTTQKQVTKNDTTKTTVFDKKKYSQTDPTSLWVVINKQRPFTPKEYMPNDLVFPNVLVRVPGNESMQLRREAASAVERMFEAASKESVPLMISSGFRSFYYQTSLYDSYVQKDGQAKADTYSARPSYSEHQTGLALDIEPSDKTCEVEICFENTAAGEWVAAHAYEYGFIMRYPADKTAVTGYQYEPWHFRYVGTELSTEMHRSGVKTLEEFFDIPAAPDYR